MSMYTQHQDHHQQPSSLSHSRYSAPASTMTATSDHNKTHHHTSTIYTHARATASINLIQNQSTISHLDTASAAQHNKTITNVPNVNHHPELSAYSQLPKHWIWNSSLFYPTTHRNMHEGFMPYSSNFSGIFTPNKTRLRDTLEITKTIDLSYDQRSYSGGLEPTSDDSLDTDDDQKRIHRPHTIHTPENTTTSISPNSSPSTTTTITTITPTPNSISASSNKKRNPYSIEELLKKPEKRPRLSIHGTTVNTFQPAIICQTRNDATEIIDLNDDENLCVKNRHIPSSLVIE